MYDEKWNIHQLRRGQWHKNCLLHHLHFIKHNTHALSHVVVLGSMGDNIPQQQGGRAATINFLIAQSSAQRTTKLMHALIAT